MQTLPEMYAKARPIWPAFLRLGFGTFQACSDELGAVLYKFSVFFRECRWKMTVDIQLPYHFSAHKNGNDDFGLGL